MSRPGLVRAREENWRSDWLAGILPGKPDLVKVEWDHAAEKPDRADPASRAGGTPRVGSALRVGSPPACTDLSCPFGVCSQPRSVRREDAPGACSHGEVRRRRLDAPWSRKVREARSSSSRQCPRGIPRSFVISSNLVMTNTQASGYALTLFYEFHISPLGSTRHPPPAFRRDQRSGRGHPVPGIPETWLARFVAAFLIPHTPSGICHLPFLLPHSPFRIPHFLAVADPNRRRG
jgi:hypothetical protein